MPVSVKLSDELVEKARIHGAANGLSVPEQIELWAKTARAAEDNPDLPVEFIKDILLGDMEDDSELTPYEFGPPKDHGSYSEKPLRKSG